MFTCFKKGYYFLFGSESGVRLFCRQFLRKFVISLFCLSCLVRCTILMKRFLILKFARVGLSVNKGAVLASTECQQLGNTANSCYKTCPSLFIRKSFRIKMAFPLKNVRLVLKERRRWERHKEKRKKQKLHCRKWQFLIAYMAQKWPSWFIKLVIANSLFSFSFDVSHCYS